MDMKSDRASKRRDLNLFRCQVLNEAAIKMTEMTNVHRFIIDEQHQKNIPTNFKLKKMLKNE